DFHTPAGTDLIDKLQQPLAERGWPAHGNREPVFRPRGHQIPVENTMKKLAALICVALLAPAIVPADDKQDQKLPKPTSCPAFDAIKKLVGEWAEDKDGKPTGPVLTSFKLTANGSVLHETLFPGTDHEMVTVYHMDGPDVVCTHYCAMGNQPHLKLEAGKDPKRLEFKCVKIGNSKSPKDAHMGHAIITITDDDHYKAEWFKIENGKEEGPHAFNLARKKAASR